MIPRLNGSRIEKDFNRYLRLVRKGVAGFIIFGGELSSLRQGIKRLQKESVTRGAMTPLIMASDLEQGLGQQVKGGTLFPPAAALAKAGTELSKAAFTAMADEAEYASINTILAPVLDINTNPDNPIISTRAFGEDPETVSSLAVQMINTIQHRGIVTCGKHFPGHGDTGVDSHISLPLIKKPIEELEKCELLPFRRAVKAGIKMIMLGHLSVPAIDRPTGRSGKGIPMSISEKAVRFLREKTGFRGIITTDAMNMGGLGVYREDEAALMALSAGVDILLHPEDPEKLSQTLQKGTHRFDPERLMRLRKGLLLPVKKALTPPFSFNRTISREITKKAVSTEGFLKPLKNPFVVLLNDEGATAPPRATTRRQVKGMAFIRRMQDEFPSLKHIKVQTGARPGRDLIPKGSDVIVAVFSDIKPSKGGTPVWIKQTIAALKDRAAIFISFGSPHLIDGIGKGLRVYACWGSEDAQKTAAEAIMEGLGKL